MAQQRAAADARRPALRRVGVLRQEFVARFGSGADFSLRRGVAPLWRQQNSTVMAPSRHFLLFVLGVFVLSVPGCDSSRTVGTCQVEWEDPLIRITEAQGRESGESIPELVLTDITLDGSKVRAPLLSPDSGATAVSEDSLRCTVPCGFAHDEGAYAFKVSAADYRSETVNLGPVEYDEREERGPCPAIIFRGSRAVQISLSAK